MTVETVLSATLTMESVYAEKDIVVKSVKRFVLLTLTARVVLRFVDARMEENVITSLVNVTAPRVSPDLCKLLHQSNFLND